LAASPGLDPKAARIAKAELGSLRKAVAAVQQEKLNITQSAMLDSIQHAASANTGGEPLIEEPGAGLANVPDRPAPAVAQPSAAPAGANDPQALLAAQDQQAAEIRQKMDEDPEFAGGLLAQSFKQVQQTDAQKLTGIESMTEAVPLGEQRAEAEARKPTTAQGLAEPFRGAFGEKTQAGKLVARTLRPQTAPKTDPTSLPPSTGGRFPLAKSTDPPRFGPGTPPDQPAEGPRTQPGGGVALDPDFLTNQAEAKDADKKARAGGTGDPDSDLNPQPRVANDTPDMDALRELLGRRPDGEPSKPEGFTRGQRLAAGFLAVANPQMYQMLVKPELARREQVAARADVLKARATQGEQAGKIVLAQLESARLGRESEERIQAGELAAATQKLHTASAASLLAISTDVEDLKRELGKTIAELEGPGADQGRRAYASQLRSQQQSLIEFMAPYKVRPDLLTPRVMTFFSKKLADIRRNQNKGTVAAAKAAQVGASEWDDYQSTREAFDASMAALNLLKTGKGFPFGLTKPGGGAEALLPDLLTPSDFFTLDAFLSGISGKLTSIAGGKNLTITELVLFGGRFPRASDNPRELLQKLENAVSFFGRRAQAMDRFRGGSQNYGYTNAVAFEDPLFGADFHDFHPSGNGNQLLRDAGMYPNVGSVQIQHPDSRFVIPTGYTDQDFVMEIE